jgi:hypothetical protein
MQTAALFAPTALCPFRLRRGYHLRLGLSFIREPPSIRVIGSLSNTMQLESQVRSELRPVQEHARQSWNQAEQRSRMAILTCGGIIKGNGSQ